MIPEIFLASDIFQKLEELRIADASVLQGFCEAVMDVARGKRIEEVGVDEDTLWLVESTRQILAAGKVDGDFSADRAVDLRKNRRRHLEEGPRLSCRKPPANLQGSPGTPPEKVTIASSLERLKSQSSL